MNLGSEQGMSRLKPLASLAALILLSTALSAQTAAPDHVLRPQEPEPNLGKLKIRLQAYHDCKGGQGCYETDLNHQSDVAIAALQRRVAGAKTGEKLALVLDIDETSLSNWTIEAQDDFGYISKDWNDWIDEKKAPAIAGTLRLYNEALKHGVAVFFITGRSDAQRDDTTDNLKAVGYHDWAGLALRGPHPSTQTTTEYKSGERKKIVDAGYKIILNVGDQISDLNGSPQAEVSVKLPNPFYYIP
jgi:acid phosphatase